MNQKLKTIFVFALILRLILAPLFYHRDLKTQNFHLQFLSQGQLNIYQYIADHKSELPYRDTFNYLPLTYLGLGSIQAILRPILPNDFFKWINDWSASQDNYPDLLYFLLISKIPYIVLDFGIAYLLYKIYGQNILKLWLFNPFSFYFIYVLANFDIIPVFFTVLAFYYLRKTKDFPAFFSLGIATALKLYPLIFFPFFLFYSHPKIKKIFLSSVYFSLPLLLSLTPFISNPAFLESFSGSGLTQKIFETQFLHLPLFPLVYTLVFIKYFFSKIKSLEFSFLLLFFAFIVFVPFHSQWLLWFFPFILSFVTQTRLKSLVFLFTLLLSLAYIALINDQYLFWGHLIPINFDFLNLPHPVEIVIQRFHQDPTHIQQNIKIIIAFLSLIFIIPFREKNNPISTS